MSALMLKEPVVWATQADSFVVVMVGEEPMSVSLSHIVKAQKPESEAGHAHYCPDCEHPKNYHAPKALGCSMPVLPGTHAPVSQHDRVSTKCPCERLFG